MNNPVEKMDPVTAWQRLMLQWEAAEISYRTAVDARATLDGVEGYDKEREAAEHKALTALTEIKKQIDKLIAETGLRRRPRADSLVVATLDSAEARSAGAAGEAKRRTRKRPEN
jgi:hypothetical protein